MIFSFTGESLHPSRWNDPDLAELVDKMISHNHYIDCSDEWLSHISKVVADHGGTNAKERFQKYFQKELTREIRNGLRIIQLPEYSRLQVELLTERPALAALENSGNEWPVYRRLIKDAVKTDRSYRNLFMLLLKAVDQSQIDAMQLGGYGSVKSELEKHDKTLYRDIAKLKISVLLDRDTDSEFSLEGNHLFDPNKNGTFQYLCGKKAGDMTYDDVYTLEQPGGWTWHMWHKRAIENYIPNRYFEDQGLDISNLPVHPRERDYFKINGDSVRNYGKSSLPKLTERMGWTEFNRNCINFTLADGREVSEIQLLFLKWLKTI